MKKYLLSIAALFIIYFASAQQVYKGLGTSNSTFLFGYTSYAAKSQCIFLPSDFVNLRSGNITRIYYRYGSTGITMAQELTRFQISMAQTTATGYTNSTFFTGLNQVFYDSLYTIPAGVTGDWFSIELDSTFAYDSTQTLIVQLIFPESLHDNWGTYGTSNNPVKKLISPDTLAVTGSGTSATWQDFGFDLQTSTGIQTFFNTSNSLDLDVINNPVTTTLNLMPRLPQNQNAMLEISNAIGRKVLSNKVSSKLQTIDVSTFAKGIYFASLTTSNGISVSRKFIVK